MAGITKESQFIIYGAGVRGIAFLQTLHKQGYGVSLFLDRDAENIGAVQGIPVKLPEDSSITPSLKRGGIVAVATADYFGQAAIAQQLYEEGYQYIIYKSNFLLGNASPYAQTLNRLHDRLTAGACMLNGDVPRFQNEMNDMASVPYISENHDATTAFVPFELLFTGQAKHFLADDVLYEGIRSPLDQSCLYYHFDYALFDLFENGYRPDLIHDLMDYKHIIEYERSKFSEKLNDGYFLHTVEKKYHVYSKMCRALEMNPQFFCEYPVQVAWNDHGYFNVVDGHHRTAFFLIKKIWKVPCIMDRADYKAWVNSDQAKRVYDHLKGLSPDQSSRIVIEHPAFYNSGLVNTYETNERDNLWKIFRHLASDDRSCGIPKVLIAGSNSLYYARQFRRMGWNTFLMESETCNAALGGVIDALMGMPCLENDHFISHLGRLPTQTFDCILALDDQWAEKVSIANLNCSVLISKRPVENDYGGLPSQQSACPREQVLKTYFENGNFHSIIARKRK